MREIWKYTCLRGHRPPCGHFKFDGNARGVKYGKQGCCICKWRFPDNEETFKIEQRINEMEAEKVIREVFDESDFFV